MEGIPIIGAFVAGTISFLSPCVLPLVPGYISIVSGISLDQLQEKSAEDPSMSRTVVLNSIFFIMGFSVTFIALGASATILGQVLMSQMSILYRVAGVLIIVFGLHLIGIFKIPFLYQDTRFHNVKPRGLIGAFVLGLAFAFGWSPCLGPILAGILTVASTRETVYEGVALLGIYSAGLGLPFLATSIGLNRFLSFYGRFKHHLRKVEIVSGVLVVAIGVMILTNTLTQFNSYLTFMDSFVLWLEETVLGVP
jgi:cytochrome c-type biogenesis protein